MTSFQGWIKRWNQYRCESCLHITASCIVGVFLFRMATECSATYKLLVIGDVNVGKTCLVHRFCDERYYDTYISTVGIDFKQKIVSLDGTPIRLQIWDTAGEERFRTLTTAYYRGAQGIVLVYDVTNLESFNHLSYWLKNIEDNASPDVIKILAGNKCEVGNHHRVVDLERGKALSENFDMPFFEVSCKNNINVTDTFLTLARGIRDFRERKASLMKDGEEAKNENVRLQDRSNVKTWCSNC